MKFSCRLVLAVILTLMMAGLLSAEVPGLISYQGRLTDDTGAPFDGMVEIKFTIYNDTLGGSSIWAEEHMVDVVDGLFTVMLGSVKAFNDDILDGGLRGLTLTIDGGVESDPPVPMVSSLYAMRAMVADSALIAVIGNNAIDSIHIKPNGISFSDIGPNGAIDGQVMKYSDKADGWIPADDEEGGSSGEGGWTDLGATVRLTTLTDEVGIGTATPWAKLHVKAEASDQVALMLQDAARDIAWQTGEHLQLGEYDGTTFEEHMRIENDGKVGMGTDDPLAHLHIQGTDLGVTSSHVQFGDIVIEDQDAVLGLFSSGSGSAGSAIGMGELDGTGTLTGVWGFAMETTSGGSGLRLSYGQSPHPYDNFVMMKVDPNGNVGIGTTSPDDAKLEVITTRDNAIIGNSYIFTGGDSCVGVYGIAGVGFPGYPVGVIGRATTGTGVLGVGDSDGLYSAGVVGRGFTGVRGEASEEIESIGVEGIGANTNLSVGVLGSTPASTGIGVRGESSSGTAIGVHAISTSTNGRALVAEATASGAGVQNYAGRFIANGQFGKGVRAEVTGSNGVAIQAIATGSDGLGIYVSGGATGRAAEFVGNISIISKTTMTKVLELGEGLDYAEGFDVTNANQIQPGAVLIIDSDNPGQLAVSTSAYDSRVAGIVAGANGLGSGVKLGGAEFDHDVALAGRVFCNVVALNGSIEPGDLLTTSDIPGYAMEAEDRIRAQGAILGKAMQSLKQGETGMILVLVTLQ